MASDRLGEFWFGAATRKTVLRSWKISERDVEYKILITTYLVTPDRLGEIKTQKVEYLPATQSIT